MAITVPGQSTSLDASKPSVLSEAQLQPFLQPDFDPAIYLNSSLPALNTAPNVERSSYNNAVSLPDLSARTQNLLSQLSAQTSRLSDTLTQLTDEIIRSGGRLAYEVEVLRGEAIGLTDTLEVGLKQETDLLVPRRGKSLEETSRLLQNEADDTQQTERNVDEGISAQPEYLAKLQTLSSVRERLDTVIKVFDEAMKWPIAPSEVSSVSNSFISVAAPETTEQNRVLEEKGKDFAEKLRNDVRSLIYSSDSETGLEAATNRIEELRTLAEVWKGTAEEKARQKFIETLQKMIEENQKTPYRSSKDSNIPSTRVADMRYGNLDTKVAGEGGYGFLQNLRSLKPEVYLD